MKFEAHLAASPHPMSGVRTQPGQRRHAAGLPWKQAGMTILFAVGLMCPGASQGQAMTDEFSTNSGVAPTPGGGAGARALLRGGIDVSRYLHFHRRRRNRQQPQWCYQAQLAARQRQAQLAAQQRQAQPTAQQRQAQPTAQQTPYDPRFGQPGPHTSYDPRFGQPRQPDGQVPPGRNIKVSSHPPSIPIHGQADPRTALVAGWTQGAGDTLRAWAMKLPDDIREDLLIDQGSELAKVLIGRLKSKLLRSYGPNWINAVAAIPKAIDQARDFGEAWQTAHEELPEQPWERGYQLGRVSATQYINLIKLSIDHDEIQEASDHHGSHGQGD